MQELLPQHADRLEVIAGDISKRVTSEKGVEAAISRVGRLDCIVLNAGVQGPVGSIVKTDVEDWKKCMDVNFFSLIHSVSCPVRSETYQREL
jgi:NADP-dependent 3-hydroxy acid dehydrogenase YdfG